MSYKIILTLGLHQYKSSRRDINITLLLKKKKKMFLDIGLIVAGPYFIVFKKISFMHVSIFFYIKLGKFIKLILGFIKSL